MTVQEEQESYLWHVVCSIVESKIWDDGSFDLSKAENINDFENIYPLLLSYVEERGDLAMQSIVEYFLSSYYFSPNRHLWLLAVALKLGLVDREKVVDLLPTIGVGRSHMSEAYRNLYDTILITLHDNDAGSRSDRNVIASALLSIVPERPR